jgi:hypothetical protein
MGNRPDTHAVMAGLVPAIHVFFARGKNVDIRDVAHEASLRALARA